MSLFERPRRHTELRAYAGSVPGVPTAVFAALRGRLDRGEGHFAADPSTGRIVLQGQWWYRAEYRVLPDDLGTRVEYEIVNVAQRAHWLAPIAGRDVLRSSASDFTVLLSQVADDAAAERQDGR